MKNILIGICILGVSLSCTLENGKLSAENGKLSGIVTYTDSDASANQADAGCKIYVVNEAAVASAKIGDIEAVMGNFQYAKSNHLLLVNTVVNPGAIKRAQDNFDAASNLAYKYVSGFKQLPAVIMAEANGAGKFSMSLKPGKYYVLVISGNVKSNNIAESKGNIDYKTVEVKSAGETLLDFVFEKHEMMWIRLMTASQRQGC